jgi:hypothetical protein
VVRASLTAEGDELIVSTNSSRRLGDRHPRGTRLPDCPSEAPDPDDDDDWDRAGLEYPIVVRDTGDGYDVIDVFVVEARQDDVAYLLAGSRPGRIADPRGRSDARRRVARIRQLLRPP